LKKSLSYPPYLLVLKRIKLKIWPFEIAGVSYFTIILYVEPDIRQDIRCPALPDIRPDNWYWYPAFRLAGYPAKSVSGASLVSTMFIFFFIPRGKIYWPTILLKMA
jgi:hypothetical protein